jgi:type II secretory pathway component GspD/PulD (secretin)
LRVYLKLGIAVLCFGSLFAMPIAGALELRLKANEAQFAVPRSRAPEKLPNRDQVSVNSGPTIDYFVVSQTLSTLADNLGQLSGIPVIAEGQLDRPLRKLRLSGRLPEIFASLNVSHGIAWWSDGLKWRLASQTAVESRRFALGELAIGDARQMVERAIPAYSAGMIEFEAQSRAIVVRGPKSAIDEVDAAIKVMRTAAPSAVTVIRYGKNGN